MTEPGEWRLLDDARRWHEAAGLEVEIRDDTRFLCRIPDFLAWARGRAGIRMEFFYREMRKRYAILMNDAAPEGGKWNYDPENRKPLPKTLVVPDAPRFEPDAITSEVMALVAARFPDHFGAVDGFAYPVTAHDAQIALADFIAHRLPQFGDWQGHHENRRAASVPRLDLHLNECRPAAPAGVLPRRRGRLSRRRRPAQRGRGFHPPDLGWREYVRGVYWWKMPEYGKRNGLDATRKLPWFYWSAETRMNCLAQSIGETRDHAYAHHIQRLMVIGNFALLAGLHPDDVDEWYLIVYADAYQWVEMPNVRGMALHGDGGLMGSKPYAGSGAYINRMSDYCKACHYDVKDATGEGACPFNALYWDFMARHRARFATNNRMAMPLRTLDRMDPARVAAIRTRAADFLARMDAGERV